MSTRRTIIGVIGGDKQCDWFAVEFGRSVVRAGCILLTGGRIPEREEMPYDIGRHPPEHAEVKDLALLGAVMEEREAAAIVARLIGVVPHGEPPVWRRYAAHRMCVHSGLPHHDRNLINGLTPDAIVVFGGGAGTLAEAAFAIAADKPLFFHAAVERLRANLNRYFHPPSPNANVNTYFRAPLRRFPDEGRKTAEGLIECLRKTLTSAVDTSSDAGALVDLCIDKVGGTTVARPTGFPGLPSDATSKATFERLVAEM